MMYRIIVFFLKRVTILQSTILFVMYAIYLRFTIFVKRIILITTHENIGELSEDELIESGNKKIIRNRAYIFIF